jgi:hypothetical protein
MGMRNPARYNTRRGRFPSTQGDFVRYSGAFMSEARNTALKIAPFLNLIISSSEAHDQSHRTFEVGPFAPFAIFLFPNSGFQIAG